MATFFYAEVTTETWLLFYNMGLSYEYCMHNLNGSLRPQMDSQ